MVLRLVKSNQSDKGKDGGPGDGGITSKFVLECLDANELGDGLLYAALHKGKYVYAKNSQQWYYWDRHCWRRDDLDLATAAVEDVAMRYANEIEVLTEQYSEAVAADNKGAQAAIKNRIGQIHKRVRRLRTDRGRRNCLKFAHTNPVMSLAVHGREFDQDPWLLAVENGVINLKTGELEDGRREDFISRRAPVVWTGIDTPAPLWEQTLDEIYGDEDLVAYLRRLFGYGITGLNWEHVFPVMHGRGRNGKSIIVETLSYILGEYASMVPSEMLLDSNRSVSSSQSSPEIMTLKGLRLAIASETDEGRRFSGAKVKWLTGGDTITARGLYDKHMTEFEPTHMLMLLTNHRPGAGGSDYAFWERCQLIPHKYSFVSREPKTEHERRADKTLGFKLRSEAPGILAWLVRGCLEWRANGLSPPRVVVSATQEYSEDEDYMSQFIEAACKVDSKARISAADLYSAFVVWFRENINSKRSYTPSQKGFSQKLMALERFRRVKVNGYYHYVGVRLNDEFISKCMDEDSYSP